jgi:hypothetical protein
MANAALDDSETDGASPVLGGEDDGEDSGGGQPTPPGGPAPTPAGQPPPAAAAPPAAGPPATTPPAGPAPAANGRAMFLGNLLKTILSGAMAGGQQGQGAFSRGMAAGSPQGQQAAQQQQQKGAADTSKALSEADLMKQQVALTGAKALSAEYMLKRLPQEQQQKYLDKISDFKQTLIKEGANVEAEGDDEKASDAHASLLNSSDPRSTSHQGRFYSLPTMDSDGKPKFDTIYVPNKDTLQSDYNYKDGDGQDQTIPAGTPMFGAMGKLVDSVHAGLQDATKSQHQALIDPKTPEEVDVKLASLQSDKDSNSTFYQHNKPAIDQKIQALTTVQAANKAKADQARQDKKDAAASRATTAAGKPADMAVATLNGKQVAGTMDELKAAGAQGATKAGAAEAEKIQNARSLINVFDSKDPDDLGVNQLAAKLDGEGKLGPAVIRFQQALNQGNTLANFDAGDPDVQRLFTKLGLATTGLMQVHVGARGSAQMLEHFEDLAKAKEMSPSAFRAALDTETKYVKMKAMRPGDVAAQKATTTTSKPNGKAADPFAAFGGTLRTQ